MNTFQSHTGIAGALTMLKTVLANAGIEGPVTLRVPSHMDRERLWIAIQEQHDTYKDPYRRNWQMQVAGILIEVEP